MKHLTVRKKTGNFQYRRGVPRPFWLAVGKREIVISLGTKDRSEALQRYPDAHRTAEAQLSAAEASPRADIVYQRTMADLKAAGLVPHDAVEVAPVPLDYTAKLDAYMKATLKAFADADPSFVPMDQPMVPGEQEAIAQALLKLKGRSAKARNPLPGAYLLGENPGWRIMTALAAGVKRPKHRLSQALEHYLQQRTTKGNQKDLPKQCALVIRALAKIVGKDDPSLDDLTLDVAEMFRKGMLEEGLTPATARRRITTIKALLTCYIKDKRLSKEVENNFIGLTVADPEGLLDRDRREALTLADIKAIVPFIQSKNADIQDLWLLQMFTGARPKELSGLIWDDVDLGHAVPHIIVRPNALRGLKTKASRRSVPLVGLALDTIAARAKGRVEGEVCVFPRYANSTNAEAVSTLQIKAMKQAGAWVKQLKVPYSLRHSSRDWVVRTAGTSCSEQLHGHESGRQNGEYGTDKMLDLLAGHLTEALQAAGVWDYPTIHLKGEVAAIPEEG